MYKKFAMTSNGSVIATNACFCVHIRLLLSVFLPYNVSRLLLSMLIGVTGQMGTGKTAVARLLARRTGFATANADRICHRLLKTKAKQRVFNAFGTTSRTALGRIVFAEPRKLAQLNAILHPLVASEIRALKRRHSNLIIDAPLLVEAATIRVDALVIVTCTRREQLARLTQRGYGRAETLKRLRHQWSTAKKRRRGKTIARHVFVVKNTARTQLTGDVERVIRTLGVTT